jgi:hypothetical protein
MAVTASVARLCRNPDFPAADGFAVDTRRVIPGFDARRVQTSLRMVLFADNENGMLYL